MSALEVMYMVVFLLELIVKEIRCAHIANLLHLSAISFFSLLIISVMYMLAEWLRFLFGFLILARNLVVMMKLEISGSHMVAVLEISPPGDEPPV